MQLKGIVTIWIRVPRGKLPTCLFDGPRHCGCGDKIVLVCHVILQDRVTNGSNNFSHYVSGNML